MPFQGGFCFFSSIFFCFFVQAPLRLGCLNNNLFYCCISIYPRVTREINIKVQARLRWHRGVPWEEGGKEGSDKRQLAGDTKSVLDQEARAFNILKVFQQGIKNYFPQRLTSISKKAVDREENTLATLSKGCSTSFPRQICYPKKPKHL